ncbi:38198_t:CDS:2, partial [Gigaspora margarita]
ELILYKFKGQECLLKNNFYPSFEDLIKDFEINIELKNQIINHNYQSTYNLNEPLFQKNFINKIKIATKNIYRFETLKAKQELVISHYAINQKDTFFLMHTSGGKSLCFILLAILFDELTLVISLLIALMKNQM